jgi:raffinose/stachyose/melibiose transport system permease protein
MPVGLRRPAVRRVLREAACHGVLAAACAVVLLPCVFLFLGSFKTVAEFFSSPFGLPHSFGAGNYLRAWREARLSVTLTNSLVATGSAIIVSTALSCLAAYAIAKYRFRGRTLVRMLFVGGLIVPVQLIMLPLFVMLRLLHVLGTIWALMIVYSVFGLPLGVLVLVGFFETIPRELSEAAEIDGAGPFVTFLRIVLPLMRPAITSVVILNGVWMWNEFFIALVLSIRPATQTLPVGILSFFGVYSTEWGLVFASVVCSALPVVVGYFLLSRQFVAGLTAGGVKG